jgi:putative tricarboxylic transport membrane protein
MRSESNARVDVSRRTFLQTSGAVGIGALVAGCLGGDGGEYPSRNIEFTVPVSEGGGMDQGIRILAPYFEDELDTNLQIEYRPGAGQIIALSTVADQENDGHFMMGCNSPLNQFMDVVEDEVNPSEELTPIGTYELEPGLIRIREDEDRFADLPSLINYADENPGEVSCSLAAAYDRNGLAMILLEEEFGVEFNLVVYDGGGESRTALLQEEVDFTHASVYNSRDLIENTTAIGVHAEDNEWPELTNDAPTFEEELDTDIPQAATEGTRYWAVPAGMEEEYPDRFDHLTDAFESAVHNNEYVDELEDSNIEGIQEFLDSEETIEYHDELSELVEEYAHLLGERISA